MRARQRSIWPVTQRPPDITRMIYDACVELCDRLRITFSENEVDIECYQGKTLMAIMKEYTFNDKTIFNWYISDTYFLSTVNSYVGYVAQEYGMSDNGVDAEDDDKNDKIRYVPVDELDDDFYNNEWNEFPYYGY